MKKIISIITVMAVIFAIVPFCSVVNAAESTPERVINIVYDDSGSMILNDNKKVDTWCQAKYAMEVFAAMLGKNDSMNIYVMSDFDNGNSGSVKLSLKGDDDPNNNVSKIHNMVTRAANTPFDSVRKAYSDLTNIKAVEKWLVVLTDGEFQGVSDMDAFFLHKEENIKVMFLSMGEKGSSIIPRETENIYFEKAENSSDILNKVTDISTRVFNSHKLKVKNTSKRFSCDVPMDNFVVFAQGENVAIEEIVMDDGRTVSPAKKVNVKYSTKAATNYDGVKVSKDLAGSVATFEGDYPAGEYEVKVSGAKTIEVYYNPNVNIAAYLTDLKGNEVTRMQDLEAGKYKITFGFVKKGTKEKVHESKLLGDIEYKAGVTNNGQKHEKTYKSGDEIDIEEGPLKIDAVAHFLDYNVVTTTLNYSIYKNKKINFKSENPPEYIVDSQGFKNGDEAMKIQATIDGHNFSKEQWAQMSLPKITVEGESKFELGKFKIEKCDEKGKLNIYPTLVGDKPSSGTYEDINLNINYDSQFGKEHWTGNSEATLKLKDERNWFERNRDNIIKGLILLAILALICGYLPLFKKYLPKGIKKSPTIEGTPNRIGFRQRTERGSYLKDGLSTIIPYKAETATIRFVPRDVIGVPNMQVKAVGGNKMSIVNTNAYAGREDILFDGVSVPEEREKPLRKGSGLNIMVTTNGMDFNCMLKK